MIVCNNKRRLSKLVNLDPRYLFIEEKPIIKLR
jgi:hypothetical protein